MQTAGQGLVAYYVDQCNALGRQEMIPLKGQVARKAKELLADLPVERVEATLTEFIRRRGRTALQLPEIAVELAREEGARGERPSDRRAAREWIAEHGWPTGCRMVRGTNAAGHVHDPLGVDPIPYTDWPYARPSFDDVAAALASQ